MPSPSITHPRTADQLAAALSTISGAPRQVGRVELIVRRPANLEREVIELGQLDPAVGLVGDNWSIRPSKTGAPNPNAQVTVMSIRALRALCDAAEWALAGDNLCVDLDLAAATTPPGTRLVIGDAELEVTADPHTGCAKFTERFGSEATRWVNSTIGRELNLRGINTRVLRGGAVRRGDPIVKR